MAFHERLGLVMVYGDSDEALWGWDGERWHRFDGSAPAARKHLGLAYDAGRDRLVLYGGASKTDVFGDTWEWDGRGWTRLVVNGPGPRMAHGMAYDASRRQVLLYGGADAQGSFQSDTWAWNGATWTRLGGAGPPARALHGMAYDTPRHRVVVASGTPPDGGPIRDDIWALDNRGWRKLAGAGVARWAPLALDPVAGDLLLVGGQSDTAVHGETWRLTDAGWQAMPAGILPPLQSHAAATDTRRNRVVVFGGAPNGQGTSADLWEWDGRRWERRR